MTGREDFGPYLRNQIIPKYGIFDPFSNFRGKKTFFPKSESVTHNTTCASKTTLISQSPENIQTDGWKDGHT